ncbi:uncharacterized protein EV420DRAFT_1569619 [Desarmillaria tabescens]|uniref:Heterokaryon incompatibility domain-containing protein n=1 Tax=Armillaria tabescens TaxID=1929756 RepID=A0AA39JQP1_ARMTA|nr:uncharacterized protein EV420DRAFT_1569619 [Desarmillaria tabescens]KAK0447038.1 hypothetical protein EV420DRAFT_1569619 [Desarmillaria tabescens]
MSTMDTVGNLNESSNRWREVRVTKASVHKQTTLSAHAETGQEETSIPVLKQRLYTGRKPIISSVLANTPCADLDTDGILEELNGTLGTSYCADTLFTRDPSVEPGENMHPDQNSAHLRWILEPYIVRNDDFGTAFAHLRRHWFDIAHMESNLRTREEADCIMRRNALVNGRITRGNVPPRRVWDLFANRVVPYWVAEKDMMGIDKPTRGKPGRPWGISHAWMSDEERVDVWTPINGYEWPVSIPKDANLNLIRIEMLNLGAEYAWLDVLCLRQAGGQGEHLRAEEWKLDVPTIGWVYRDTSVTCYFSGLGRPLSLKPGDLESERCWFNRAWTLQETSDDSIIGGETDDNRFMEEEIRTKFHGQLASLQLMRRDNSVVDVLSQMQGRVSTNPMDRVVGLVYLLDSRYMPIYDALQPQEDAWVGLVDAMAYWSRTDLLFLYPEPGNRKKYWRPSWEQTMKKTNLRSCSGLGWLSKVGRTEETDTDWFEGPSIDPGDVRGLAYASDEGESRQGELIVKDHNGTPHRFGILADHQYPIPDALYTLIGARGWSNETFWAVGKPRQDGKFEKVSVVTVQYFQTLSLLGIVKWEGQMVLC